MLWLLGLGSYLKRVMAVAVAKPALAGCILLALVAGWQWRQAGKWHHRADGYQTALKSALKASDDNIALALAQNKAWEAKSTQAAKDNRYAEDTLRAQLGARSVAYADRMRADKVCRSYPATPGQVDPAPINNRPGRDAVVLERADFDILTDNTARLNAANQWGQDLIAAGLAVPTQ